MTVQDQQGNSPTSASDSATSQLGNPGIGITVTDIDGANIDFTGARSRSPNQGTPTGFKKSEVYNNITGEGKATHIAIGDVTTSTADGYFLGNGDDTVVVTNNLAGAQNFVNFGNGDNTLQVGGYITGNSQLDFGTGNDTVTVGTNIAGSSAINLGAGNDTIIANGYLGGSARINAGDGNDYISVSHINGASVPRGAIDGGTGYDVVVFTKDQPNNDAYTASLIQIFSVEEIHLDGANQTLKGVTFANLFENGMNQLYINGSTSSKVELGSTGTTDMYGTTPRAYNTSTSWNVTGTAEKDGHTYDVYTLGADSNYKVFIEQGIQVV